MGSSQGDVGGLSTGPAAYPRIAERLRSSGGLIVVTGATGWLGRIAVDVLAGLLGPDELRSRTRLYASRPRSIEVHGVRLDVAALEEWEGASGDGGLLLHFAYLTRDAVAELGESRYRAVNTAIGAHVLEQVRRSHPDGVLYVSSGAVHGPDEPYAELKRSDEHGFAEACEQIGTRLCVPRLFNLTGPHMRGPQRYALGSLICAALRGEPLEVRASHRVVRSYVAGSELVALALAVLLDPGAQPITTFDTAGSDEVEIGDLAVSVARALGRSELPVVRAPVEAGRPDDRYVGDARMITALRARHGIAESTLEDQIRATATTLG